MHPNLTQLTQLHHRFREVPVLSLYLPVGEGGTLMRSSWRLRADALLRDQRGGVAETEMDRLDAFDRAHAIIVDALGEDRNTPPGVWVLFATDTELLFSSVLEGPLPAFARLSNGPVIAPLVGLPELRRRGAVAVLDAKRARVFAVDGPEFEEAIDLLAEWQPEEAADIGVAKRATTASGVRGQSAKDRAQRAKSAETLRFAKRVKEALVETAGQGGFIVFGGAHRTSQAVAAELNGRERVTQLPALEVEMAEHELREAVAGALSDIHCARGASALDRVEASVGVDGLGCLGWNDTLRALKSASVQTLLVARDLILADPDRAEDFVADALEQGATVVQVSGERGRGLYEEHDGVAALLRYSPGVPAEPITVT